MSVCFFTSIGDDLSLIQYIKINYDYDIVCNYYGINNCVYKKIKLLTKMCTNEKISKFQSLYRLYENIKDYDQIIIFDDDAIITDGNIDILINLMIKYNLEIISPSHDHKGKISHAIQKHQIGNHIYRQVNFVEMNFPIFSKSMLEKFMSVYDGNMVGWGIDYIYSNLATNIGIVDDVIVYNPLNSVKIENLLDQNSRKKQWHDYKNTNSLQKIIPRTLKYI